MRALKIILATLSGLLGLVWLVGIFLPGDYHVERSVEVDAPVSIVFAQVNDFRNWEAWSPWIAADPTIENTYGGPDSGVGATSSWTSESSGEGKMTITVSEPDEHITTALDFGEMGEAEAHFHFEKLGDEKTRVTWSMDGENQGAIGHYFAVFMDGMIGPYYERGLASLKARAEEIAAQPQAPDDAAVETDEAVAEATGDGDHAADEAAEEGEEAAE